MNTLPHDHGNISTRLMSHIPSARDCEATAELMKLMADSTRLRIFWLLCHCEECVINISALMGVSSPAVSHHLRQLKSSGLVAARRQGKEMYYSVPDSPRADILHKAVDRLLETECPAKDQCELPAASPMVHTMGQVHRLLTADPGKRYTVDELAHIFHMNTTTLKSEWRTVYGTPIGTYMRSYRIKKAMELLDRDKMSVSEAAAAVGYENPGKFSTAFKSVTGMLPREYIKGKIKNGNGK